MIISTLGGMLSMKNILCTIVLSKVEDQMERVDHLATLIPDTQLDWTPPITNGFSVSVLLGHLMESLAGFCAVLYAAKPDSLRHFIALKNLPVNTRIGPTEARARLGAYREHIREGFAALRDPDLGRMIPTVFVPEGEPVLSLLLTNSEHLASHKYQLFIYLRMLGVNVASKDLYHFSGQ
jgi:hypothetical protein